jgi:uncharacterized surface protein with fasciclin (FAS1) repeats
MARRALPGRIAAIIKRRSRMRKSVFPLALAATALAITGCNSQNQARKDEASKGSEAVKQAGDKTIAASLDTNSSFFKAAKAAGLDATLAGPGPYTVIVPDDAAFAKLPQGTVDGWMKPESRTELTRVLTNHIMPGTVLTADIGKAIDDGKGKAVLATVGGGTLTATREGDKIVLTDGDGHKATMANSDETLANGVVHRVDTVLMPSKKA